MKKWAIVLAFVSAVTIGLALGRYYSAEIRGWLNPPVVQSMPGPEEGEGESAPVEEASVPLAPTGPSIPVARSLVDPDTGEIELEGSVTTTVTDEDGETRTLTLPNVRIRLVDE